MTERTASKFIIALTVLYIVTLLFVEWSYSQTLPPAPERCMSVQALHDAVASQFALKNMREVTHDKIAMAGAIYNSVPPKTNHEWDHAFLIDGPGNSGALAVSEGENVCGLMVIEGDHWQRLLDLLEPHI